MNTTIYANLIGMKLTPNELVLEFGTFFPNGPNQAPPMDYKPDVRVVMQRNALPGLIQGLTQAQAQQAQADQQQRSQVGFPRGSS